MREVIVGGVAFAALISGPAFAQSGYVGVSRSHIEADSGGLSGDGDVNAISGAVAFGIRGRLEFQADAMISEADDVDDTVVGGTFHVVTRSDGWMFGAFAGGTNSDLAEYVAGGVEGGLYWDRVSVTGSLAAVSADDLDTDGFVASQQLRYFVHRDFRLEAALDYGSFDSAGVDWDAIMLSLGAEYRIQASPFSFYGGVSQLEISDADLDAQIYTLGIRYNFDESLAFRNEAGAGLMSATGFGALF